MRISAKCTFLFVLLAAFVCLTPSLSTAQDLDNVTISGSVTDQNRALIPGAIVTATLRTTRAERKVIADGNGQYRLIQLPPGIYNVTASFTNFAAEEKSDLNTLAGQNVTLDFVLQPAAISATAVVVSIAEAPQVDTMRTIVGGTVTTSEVESLPVNNRSPFDLIFTLGGGLNVKH